MTLHPNCKLNIGLHIVGKREDGYHNIETIFYPVYGLYDILEVDKAEDFRFEQEGIQVDCNAQDNLIVRTYELMRKHYPQVGGLHIRFTKRIPFGAGLGGGSSDAAHTALAINELYHLHLTQEQLVQLITPLGADCPFFIYNTPCFATGIGQVLTPIDFSLRGKYLVMLKPDVAVSTREAYSGLTQYSPLGMDYRAGLETLTNDFETTVFRVHPELQTIKQSLLSLGAIYAAMSGSGSTIFGLFEFDGKDAADTLLRTLEEEFASMVIFHNTLGETQS